MINGDCLDDFMFSVNEVDMSTVATVLFIIVLMIGLVLSVFWMTRMLCSPTIRRSLPRLGDSIYKSLRDYTNEELISYLDRNESTDLTMMSGLLSEILRRMNEKTPILPIEKTDVAKEVIINWGGKARCQTADGRIVNMAEEFNKRETD